MIRVVELPDHAVYDDGTLLVELGISPSATARARREGKLRFCKVGHRTFYLGQWVLQWLEAASAERARTSDV